MLQKFLVSCYSAHQYVLNDWDSTYIILYKNSSKVYVTSYIESKVLYNMLYKTLYKAPDHVTKGIMVESSQSELFNLQIHQGPQLQGDAFIYSSWGLDSAVEVI